MTRFSPDAYAELCARTGRDPATGRRARVPQAPAAASEAPAPTTEAGGAPRRRQRPEQELHRAVARVLDALGLHWHHSPLEGGAGRQGEGAVRHALGARAGWPDVVVIDPPATMWRAVAIELKRPGGGRLSEAQRGWLRTLHEAGWLVAVCRSVDEVRAVLAVAYPALIEVEGADAVVARCRDEATGGDSGA